MTAIIAKGLVGIFGIYLIFAGMIMLIKPKKARALLRKAGSTNIINYTELGLRMIPAVGLILSAEYSKFELFFKLLGWFMFITSIIIMIIPRQMHHQYSIKSSEILKPRYFQLISPFSFLFGAILIYAIV